MKRATDNTGGGDTRNADSQGRPARHSLKDWQRKLRIMIDAYDNGHPLVHEEFYYAPAISREQAMEIMDKLDFEVPDTLRSLYAMVSRCTLAGGEFRILSLTGNDLSSLKGSNDEFLKYVQDKSLRISGIPLRCIFGSDGGGDFFCVSEHDSVVVVGHDSELCEVITDSPDSFLGDICLGPGYLRYFDFEPEEEEDDDWIKILRDLGFLTST